MMAVHKSIKLDPNDVIEDLATRPRKLDFIL